MEFHKNHKLIPINDEESLKKENISIEDFIDELNKYFEKMNKLKEKTENEMIKLDNLFYKSSKDLAKSFEEKHLALTKQEDDIKEKLQNEVTKVKEKLEQNLSHYNHLIKSCEKIKKGMKTLEKQEKAMIKNLSYVSKINKNNYLTKKYI